MRIGLLLPVPSSFPVGIKKFLIVTGIIFCLTIIGIVPGLILLVYAAVLPSIMIMGACPVCENKLLYGKKNGACTCYYCHTRLLIKNSVLVTMNGKAHPSLAAPVMEEAHPKKGTPWYKTTPATVVFLIIFAPLGIFTMWKYMKWNKTIKWILTGVFALVFLLRFANTNWQQTDTTKRTTAIVSVTPTPEKKNTSQGTKKPTPVPTEDCSQSANSDMCIRMEINREPKLNATTDFSNAGLVVTNNDSTDWRLCTVTMGSSENINTAYEVSGWDIAFPAHQTTTVPWSDFAQDNGNRFNYYSTQPKDIELDCSVNHEQEHLRIN